MNSPAVQPLEPQVVSFDDLNDDVIDDITPYGCDPFDVLAALEEEYGVSIWRS